MKSKLYYMIDNSGTVLEASPSAGYWEKDGITNLDVIMHCRGLGESKFFVGTSEVRFRVKEFGNEKF